MVSLETSTLLLTFPVESTRASRTLTQQVRAKKSRNSHYRFRSVSILLFYHIIFFVHPGQVFLDYKGELEEVYKIYCQNHDDAISLLETYEKDENIQKHVLECLEKLR